MIPNLVRVKSELPFKRMSIIPSGWTYEGEFVIDDDCASSRYRNKTKGLLVAISFTTMDDDTTFIHLSVSRKSRLPSWEDLKDVKDCFLGEEREAFHILPKKSEYVNLHPFCMHIWSSLNQ